MPDVPDRLDDDALPEVLEIRARAESRVIIFVGATVCLLPVLWVFVQVLSAFTGVRIPIDDRILGFCLTAMGSVVTYAFGRDVITSLLSKR